MTNANYQAIINTVDSFPPLPATATKVLQVTSDPESSAHNLMEAILPDPSMCTAILKVANSAFYGRPKEVGSLETAVMILGFNEIQSIVLGKAVFDSFKNVPNKHQEIDQFWRHSLTCGLAAKIIAEKLGLSPGTFFIAGLIHDLGKLALLLTFPIEYAPKTWFVNQNYHQITNSEIEQFTISHSQVAARLLKRWFFPPPLIVSTEHHHTPELATHHHKLPLIVQLADLFSYLVEDSSLLEQSPINDIQINALPNLQPLWTQSKMVWQDTMLEELFSQLQLDIDNNSNLMSILST